MRFRYEEYEEGEIVRIVSNTCGHQFEIGQLVKIREIDFNGGVDSAVSLTDECDYWYLDEDDIEKVDESEIEEIEIIEVKVEEDWAIKPLK